MAQPVSSSKAEVGTSVREEPAGAASKLKLHILLIFAFWAAIYVPGMFTPALLDDADSIHAEAAREIVVRQDWVTLHVNGLRYLEKAPLMYWGMAASFKLFGVSEWAARLPLALGALATLLATYAIGRRNLGERAAFWSAVVLATGIGAYLFTRILIPDLLVGLWLTIGFDFFLRGLDQERPSRWSCWGLAAAAALNVLTKGLIGIVFPAAIIALYLLLTGSLKHLLRIRLISSALVLVAIAAPWHILASLANPPQGEARGFFWWYFVNEHFLRYLNKRVPMDYDTVPLWAFWAMMLLWLLPWCVFLVQALGRVPHKLRDVTKGMDRQQRALLLFALWAAVVLLFFSFSSRQEYYTVPALPALALIVGNWLAAESESKAGSRMRRWGRVGAGVLMAAGVAAGAAGAFFLSLSRTVPASAELSDLLRKNPGQYALSLGHVLDLTPQALGMFRYPLTLFAVSFVLGTVVAFYWRRRGECERSNWALAIMMVFVLTAVHAGLVMFSPILSSKDLAMAIQERYKPGDVIAVNGPYEEASTLNFYIGQNIHIINNRLHGNMLNGSLYPDAPRVFEDDGSFARLWNGSRRVFVWTEEGDMPPGVRPETAHVIAKRSGKMIYSNRPDR